MPPPILCISLRSAVHFFICFVAIPTGRLSAQTSAPAVSLAELPAGLTWSPLVSQPGGGVAAVLHAPQTSGGAAYLITGDSAYTLPPDSSYRRVLPHAGKLVLAPATELDFPADRPPLPVAYATTSASDTLFLSDGAAPSRTAFIGAAPSELTAALTDLDRVNSCTSGSADLTTNRHLVSRALATRHDTLAVIGRFYGTSLNRSGAGQAQSHFIATAVSSPDGSLRQQTFSFTELSGPGFSVQPFGKQTFALVSPREVLRFDTDGEELALIALPEGQTAVAAAPDSNPDRGMWLLTRGATENTQLVYLDADGQITARYSPSRTDQTWQQLTHSSTGRLTVAGHGNAGYFAYELSAELDGDPQLTDANTPGARQPERYTYPLPDTAGTPAPFAILDAFPECAAQEFSAIGFTGAGDVFIEFPHHSELRSTNGQYLGKGPASLATATAPTPLADGIQFSPDADTVVVERGGTEIGRFRPVSAPRNTYVLSQLVERPDGGALAVYISTPLREPPLTELLLINTAGELEGRAYLGQVDTVLIGVHGLLAYGAIAARGPFPAISSLSFIPWSTLSRPAALPYAVEVCTLPYTVTLDGEDGRPREFLLTREQPYVNNGAVTFTVVLAERAELNQNLDTILVDATCVAPARGAGRIEVVLRDTTLGHRVNIEGLGAGLRHNTSNADEYTVQLIDEQGCRIERTVPVGTSAPIEVELYTQPAGSGWEVSADLPDGEERTFSYDWSNGARGSGVNTYADSGQHVLTLSELRYDGSLGCTQDFTFTLSNRTVGVHDATSFGASLTLSTRGELSVGLPAADPRAELRLFDLAGRDVYTRRIAAGRTRLTRPQQLARGTYVAQLRTGGQRLTRLIVW